LDKSRWKNPKDINLADEECDQPGSIDLLIGAQTFYEMLRSGKSTRPGNYPVQQETLAGKSLVKLHLLPYRMTRSIHSCYDKDNSMEPYLNRFWEVEAVEQTTMTAEKQAYEQHFITHTTQ